MPLQRTVGEQNNKVTFIKQAVQTANWQQPIYRKRSTWTFGSGMLTKSFGTVAARHLALSALKKDAQLPARWTTHFLGKLAAYHHHQHPLQHQHQHQHQYQQESPGNPVCFPSCPATACHPTSGETCQVFLTLRINPENGHLWPLFFWRFLQL